jgi:hypothetical protein
MHSITSRRSEPRGDAAVGSERWTYRIESEPRAPSGVENIDPPAHLCILPSVKMDGSWSKGISFETMRYIGIKDNLVMLPISFLWHDVILSPAWNKPTLRNPPIMELMSV